jgi:hypothetical protein
MTSIIVVRYNNGDNYAEDRYPQENHEWIIDGWGGVTIFKDNVCISYYAPHNLIWVRVYDGE